MAVEVVEFLLNPCLLLFHGGVLGAIVGEDAVLQVHGLVDVALVAVEREEVVGRHHGGVVEVTAHEHEFAEVGGYVVHLHPKHGVLRVCTAEIVAALEHGAEGCDFLADCGGVLVKVGAFLNEIYLYLVGGQVAVGDADFAVLLLIEDVVAVHECLGLDDVFLRKILVAVELVVVCLHLSAQQELEEIGEEVFAAVGGRCRIVERGVGVLREVEGAVDVAPPRHVFGHGRRCGEVAIGGAFGCSLRGRLFLVFGRLAACGWLCHGCKGAGAGEDKREERAAVMG